MSKYVAKQSAEHAVHLQGKSFKAEHGVLDLSDEPDAAAELDKLLKSNKRPDIVQAFVKIDEDAAKALVRAHQEAQKPQAHQGAVNSTAMAEANKHKIDQTPAMLLAAKEKADKEAADREAAIDAAQVPPVPASAVDTTQSTPVNPLAALMRHPTNT